MSRVAKATQSQALEADALHFSSDLWASLAVLAGLVGVRFGIWWADSAAALAVALLVCVAGWRLGRRTIDTLTDTAPAGAAANITDIADERRRRGRGRARARPRRRRQDLHRSDRGGEPHLAARPRHRDQARGRRRLARNIPGAEPIVTTDPIALDNETVLDRVMVIARNRALAVHHVTVHNIQDRLAVALDLEVDGKLSLAAAHELADGLEDAIAAELGPGVEVETHIEPLQPADASGREAPPERVIAVETALAELAAQDRALRNVHDVRVRETDDGEIVNFHCHVDPDMTVQTVHEKVDALERALKQHSSMIKRVIGHAEPMRVSIRPRFALPPSNSPPDILDQIHAHRHCPADPPERLSPARLAGGNRQSRRRPASDADQSARDAEAQAQSANARRRRWCSTATG